MVSNIYAKIERQCGWWDMFARTVPVGGIMIFMIVWLLHRDITETLIVTGLSVMCITLALWWYWAITSIAHLARSNFIIHDKLGNILQEIQATKHELQEIKKDVTDIL